MFNSLKVFSVAAFLLPFSLEKETPNVDKRRNKRSGAGRGAIMQSIIPLLIWLLLLPTPHHREQKREWPCVEVWVIQRRAVAAGGSWSLATCVLELQPEILRLGNGSKPNYSD